MREISLTEYTVTQNKIKELPGDEAAALQSRLSEKYYATLDLTVQLTNAIRGYEEVEALIDHALEQETT